MTERQEASRSSNKKRVRFPEESSHMAVVVCTLPHRQDSSEEENADLFYTRSDYHMTRSAAKVVSKESERYGFSNYLKETFTEKNKAAQECLNLWTASGHSRRGLERWANKAHGEIRQKEQFHATMAVLRAQDDMLYEKKAIDAEGLRKISHKATRSSRHFARMMGKADALAAASPCKGDDNTTVITEALTVADDSTIASERTEEKEEDFLRDGKSSHSGGSSPFLSPRRVVKGMFSFNSKHKSKGTEDARVSRVA